MPPISKHIGGSFVARNLIYHITPMGCWRKNIAELQRYERRFDGVRLAVVAQGDGLEQLADIAGELTIFDKIWPMPNDPMLREMPSLAYLLDVLPRYASVDIYDDRGRRNVTFFAHTKGVTHEFDVAIRVWTQLLYDKNLKNIQAVDHALDQFPIVGCFKRYGEFSNMPPGSRWHYSGTFFWFRNADIYSRRWQEALPAHRYGAEAFPGLLFSAQEGGCLFADNCQRPTDLKYLNSLLML